MLTFLYCFLKFIYPGVIKRSPLDLYDEKKNAEWYDKADGDFIGRNFLFFFLLELILSALIFYYFNS